MLLQIADILTPAEVSAIRDTLAGDALWRDGAATAKGRARAAKNNQQAATESRAVRGVIEKVQKSLRSDPVFKAAAQPAAFARIMISRYGAGMAYGDHVDAPYIEGQRTDLSFTLFLSDPDAYEGGELVIQSAGAEDSIKLPAGALVLYPATNVHRVAPVLSGERIAAVGWVRSRIRSAEHRALVFELESAIAELAHVTLDGRIRDRLSNLRNNLLRAFGE